MTYDETTGNIIAKSDLGADAVFGYGETTAPHALDLVSGVATDWGTDAVAIGYTDFGKVSSITEGDWTYTIAYSPDGARAKSNLSDGQGGYTMRHYGDRTEKTRSNGNNLDYLSYLCHGAIVVHHGTGRSPLPPTPTAILQGYYDAQGSLIALVDANGFVVQRYAYDPWGRRVNPEDWSQADTTQTDVYHINRGYTMHEHLREFGLINMNGRVFDPAVAQFLSPDNYVQDANNWLNYNRYTYCLNNPLKYTDPDGEYWHIVAGAIIGLASNLYFNWDSFDNFWEGFASGVTGAVTGALEAAYPNMGVIMGCSAINNAVSEYISQNTNENHEINWGKVFCSFGEGIVGGGLGCLLNGYGDKIGSKITKGIKNQGVAEYIGRSVGGGLGNGLVGFSSSFFHVLLTDQSSENLAERFKLAAHEGVKPAVVGFLSGAFVGLATEYNERNKKIIQPVTQPNEASVSVPVPEINLSNLPQPQLPNIDLNINYTSPQIPHSSNFYQHHFLMERDWWMMDRGRRF